MISFYVSPEMREFARASEKAINTALAERNAGDNPTGLEAGHRYYKGLLGETAFAAYLSQFDVQFRWDRRVDGLSQSDGVDFYMKTKSGREIRADVKTDSTRHYDRLLVSERHYDRHSAVTHYISLHLSENHDFVEIGGFLPKSHLCRERMCAMKQNRRREYDDEREPAMNYFWPIASLYPIEQMTEGLAA